MNIEIKGKGKKEREERRRRGKEGEKISIVLRHLVNGCTLLLLLVLLAGATGPGLFKEPRSVTLKNYCLTKETHTTAVLIAVGSIMGLALLCSAIVLLWAIKLRVPHRFLNKTAQASGFRPPSFSQPPLL